VELVVSTAAEGDARELTALQAAVARELTRRYGKGPWSSEPTEKMVRWAIKSSCVLVGRVGDARIVATLLLQTKKPWAIDRSYFTAVPRPLYLTSMAVEPPLQRQGIGRLIIEKAKSVARSWPAQAIRLDAYDADAGAGGFYEKCGFRETGRAGYRGTGLIYYELLL
jgi:GNAT superfamily N-acetyltransferase